MELVLLIQYCFQVSCECLGRAIFGVKFEGAPTTFADKIVPRDCTCVGSSILGLALSSRSTTVS